MDSDKSTTIECPHCKKNVETLTKGKNGLLSWIGFAFFCITGLWCGCCLIPFCFRGFRDIKHLCPDCGLQIGIYKRI